MLYCIFPGPNKALSSFSSVLRVRTVSALCSRQKRQRCFRHLHSSLNSRRRVVGVWRDQRQLWGSVSPSPGQWQQKQCWGQVRSLPVCQWRESSKVLIFCMRIFQERININALQGLKGLVFGELLKSMRSQCKGMQVGGNY